MTAQPSDPLAYAMPAAFALALVPAIWAVSTAGERSTQAPPGFAQAVAPSMPLAPPDQPAPPPVLPLELAPVAPETAVQLNARVPFSTGPNPAARAFNLAANEAIVARSTDCLAAAVLYEAGDDREGQRAVAQVVINRMRHPAFPKTICGVVFQGQERRTGCQFTFTCDGALNRSWSPDAWDRARGVATQALTGGVYRKVGHATHYHTDWVVPYWSDSLDKIAAVGTHLFFRWEGWWGTPPAFRFGHAGGEPRIAKLARFSLAHRGEGDEMLAATDLEALEDLDPAKPRDMLSDGSTFLARVRAKADPDRIAALALETCGARDYCKFMAWTDKDDMPEAFPVAPAKLQTMAFSYLRNKKTGFDKPLWNCETFARSEPAQCMKGRTATAKLRVKLREPAERAAADEDKPVEKAALKIDVKSPRRRPGA